MAANTEYTKIKESTISAFFSKLKAFFWPKADVVNINLSDVAVTGDYDDLVNKPTIPPGSVVDQTYDATSVNAQSGVAMAGALATKADTTDIPDAVEANPTVPSGTTPTALANLKVGNDYYSVPSPTVPDDLDDLSDVNLGTPSDGDVLTYDSTAGKWVADAPSGGELSTDVVADKASNVKASTPKSVYDFVKPQSQSSIPAGGLQPGILYNLSVLTGSVTIDLATPADANVANEYAFTFTAGSTVPSITWPASIVGWGGNCLDSNGQPQFVAGNIYEVSIRNNIGAIMEIDLSEY